MAILPIRTFGDPVLRERARDVEQVTEVHRRLVSDMLETMRDAPGVGLAGPQVGVLERVFVWEVEGGHGALFNPVIVRRSDEKVAGEEGCLSIPGLAYDVERHASVTVEGLDADGRPVSIDAGDDDFLARVFQHEIDHLDGVLFIDRLPDGTRKEALRSLREQLLGLPGAQEARPPREEAL
ncbi:MAG TPA: peptide deformylase [Actinomycetota bacterium]|nr:peptide deformylase [Actinomycetota bacterium]